MSGSRTERSRRCAPLAAVQNIASTVAMCVTTSTISMRGRPLMQRRRLAMRSPRLSLLLLTGAMKPLSRLRRRRRSRARSTLAAAIVGVAVLGSSTLVHPTPRIVWNASQSVPLGLYWVAKGSVRRGDLILAELPPAARQLAADRGYLPSGVPLVKPVAAISDDAVCAVLSTIIINGQRVAERLPVDSRGRPLPTWEGCYPLREGEVFLLKGDVPDSFDGRYFGPIDTAAIVGKLIPLWTW
jgi:conjugative transfer signal peptidase TraF